MIQRLIMTQFSQAWLVRIRVFAILGLVLTLTACGFHLKGVGKNAVATFKSIELVNTDGVRADVLRSLEQQLKASNVKIVNNMAEAEIVLSFQPTGYTVSRTSISGQGDASSELIKMMQPIRVEEVATEKELLKTVVQVYRDRRIDNAAALASNRELRSIQQQMANDIAVQIIDRINRSQLN
ncbi:LPS assembly lipoprotein LptE [Hydrogenovibrio sp. 3SP14C1]|uniref:LPS-assembly lipoprotein LptE n=1 Tax=Hydrogenovibrio sp. 3SP14C1 TaxID=3038774 RepID=UPI002416BC23|nr:LPS assembly lipoprotein LptE [Hydrogenovibrio sp. 3SP14C1]MDG4811715.1 LPS assembly lipoprotein LptE [Hydrogenovibrio sp. 3SP14C1]